MGSPDGSIPLCVAVKICDLRVENRGIEYASGKSLGQKMDEAARIRIRKRRLESA